METQPAPPKRAALATLAPVLIAFAVFAAGFLLIREFVSIDTLRANREALDGFVAQNFAFAFLVFVAVYMLAITCSLPISIYFTFASGFLFGAWFGGAATWLASMLGTTLLFLILRTAVGGVVRRHGGWMRRFERGFSHNALNYLFALRLVPVVPFWITNLTPAFFGYKLRDYSLATALGILPTTFVYTAVGDALHAAVAAGTSLDPGAASRALLFSPQVIGPILGLAALALLPVLPVLLRKLRAPKA